MVNNEISRQPTFGKSRDKKNSRKCFEIFFSNLLVFFSYFITQFTKRTFVRHKNTQDILIFYMDQLFMLVTNPNIFLRSSQHFWFYFNFLIFFKIFYFIIKVLQITSKISESRNFVVRCFCFCLFVNRLLRGQMAIKTKSDLIWGTLLLQSCNQNFWNWWKKLD